MPDGDIGLASSARKRMGSRVRSFSLVRGAEGLWSCWRQPGRGDSFCKGHKVHPRNRFGDVGVLRESEGRFCGGEGNEVEEAREQRSAQC